MPQSTNLNTPPYFEDFDPDNNYHKVLFRPGFPLQARELTTLQSILQDQIEKFGSSIYTDGAMVVPGRVIYNLNANSILIEDEYFGISSDLLKDYIVGQIIVGNTSGVRAKVSNFLTSEESEKGYTTLYVDYLSASSNNIDSSFLDDEILIAESAFSIGNTVIQANTDFAKCVSSSASYKGSSAKITTGIYFAKGYFIKVKDQEIILDQFGSTPSYKIGLQILEEIVTPEDDTNLTDPSQGYSNYAAPGAHRFKLNALLTKKALNDESVTDFIELLRLEEGSLQEIVVDSKKQLARNFEATFARRTYDESGDYVVNKFTFSKEESLSNGVNNGIFTANEETNDGNSPSKDIFEMILSAGKAYVRGYEIDKIGSSYIDVEKPRDTDSKNNATIRTDGRGVEFRTTSAIPYARVASSISGIVTVHNSSDTVIGYAIWKSYEEYATYNLLRLSNIRFVNSAYNISNIAKVRVGGTIDYANNTSSGGTLVTLSEIVGKSKPYLFNVFNTPVKNLEDTKVQNVLTRFSGTFGTNNTISISNRGYYSQDTSDYTLKISGDPSVTIDSASIDGSGTLEIVVTGATVTSGTNFILFGPERIDNPTLKLASHQKMRFAKLSDIANKYSVNDSTISLGTTRVSKIHAIYNPSAYNTPQEVLPKLTLTAGTGTFAVGEVFVGRTTGSKGRVVRQNNNDLYFVYETFGNFVENEEIYGYKDGTTRTISIVDRNGFPNLKSRYKLDDGQRNQVFEYSTLTKTSSESTISGDLFIVFDYFKDDVPSGQFYSVNSYYNADYDDIPSYKVNGEVIYLSDHIDWRINKENIFTGSTTGEYNNPFTLDASVIVDNIGLINYGGTTTNRFVFSNNYILPTGTTDGDIEYYLPRTDNLYLSSTGKFIVQKGNSSLIPKEPLQPILDAIKLYTIKMPAYLRDIKDISVKSFENRRYTMRDIGNLEQRITNLEYYTTLSLLETDTSNLFIADSQGNNRLKNGFVVDNFLSHNIGDTSNPNYKCSMDMSRGHLRPQHYTTNTKLKYNDVPERYQKGRYLMLDFNEIPFITQPYAAVVENVNPYAVVAWNGRIVITPESDDWFEENRIPDSITDIEGNFNALFEELGGDPNTGLIPTQWSAWTTVETDRWNTGRSGGITEDQVRIGSNFTIQEEFERRIVNDQLVNTQFVPWIRSRNISVECSALKPNSRMYCFFGDRDVNAYCTPKIIRIQMASGSVAFQAGEQVTINSVGRKFRARLSNANDGVDNGANYDFMLSSASYNTSVTYLNLNIESMQELSQNEFGGNVLDGDIIIGSSSGATATVTSTALNADDQGQLLFSYFIPDPNDDSNPRWASGDVNLRVTGDPNNTQISGFTDTTAEATYSSTGTVFTRQFEVENIRNGAVAQTGTTIDARTVTTVLWVAPPPRGGGDPLAQSFFVDDPTGCFLTKVDIYFQSKDSKLPVWMEIRNIVNGYPGPQIYGSVTKNPDQVNISDDATAVTQFKFDSPIYLPPNNEYCFVLLSSSTDFKVWLSEMGADDLNGEKITKQPYLGVLFKSQNNTAWTAAQLQDFKFTLYKAQFKINETPTFSFVNNNDGNSQFTRLRRDPIELNVNSGRIKVHHKNHGNHDNSSHVEIKGVTSEKYTSLFADWSGAPGTAVTVIGNRDSFASLDNINGQAPANGNPGYLKIGTAIYTYNPGSVGALGANDEYTILTIDRIDGDVPSDGFKSTDGWTVENYVIDGIPLTFINTVHTQLEWITLDSYQINLSSLTRNTVGNITIGGDNVYASQNIQYSQFTPSVEFREYPGTAVVATYSGTSGTSLGDSSYSDPAGPQVPSEKSYLKDASFYRVDLNRDNYTNSPKVIASLVNEERQMIGAKSSELRITLGSTNPNISPVIFTDRISLTSTSNRVANFDGAVSEEFFFNSNGNYTDIGSDPTQDYNPSNYITKVINLANESTGLRIDFTAFNPTETDIDVYVKLLSGDEALPENTPWVEVTNTNYANVSSELQFIDYNYEYNLSSGSFTRYAVKIRMRSNNQSIVPIIKDFRCIALA